MVANILVASPLVTHLAITDARDVSFNADVFEAISRLPPNSAVVGLDTHTPMSANLHVNRLSGVCWLPNNKMVRNLSLCSHVPHCIKQVHQNQLFTIVACAQTNVPDCKVEGEHIAVSTRVHLAEMVLRVMSRSS